MLHFCLSVCHEILLFFIVTFCQILDYWSQTKKSHIADIRYRYDHWGVKFGGVCGGWGAVVAKTQTYEIDTKEWYKYFHRNIDTKYFSQMEQKKNRFFSLIFIFCFNLFDIFRFSDLFSKCSRFFIFCFWNF